MPTVTRTPSASRTPTGKSAYSITGGSASIHAALADGTDGTYIAGSTNTTTAQNQQCILTFADLALPAGSVIEWIKPVVREAHSTEGYVTVAQLIGYNSEGTHPTPFRSTAIGTNPADNTLRTTDGPVFVKAADGTKWSDCDPTRFEAVISNGPRYRYPTVITTPGKLAKVELTVSYKIVPVVSGVTPAAGTIGDTQPQITWATGEAQEAYRVIIVGSGQVDSSGRTAGSAGYDPSTVNAPAWDSGKVYAAVQSTVPSPTTHLDNGSAYYIYVRSWGVTVNDTELPSLWTTSGAVTIANLVITAPTLTVTDDATTYTVRASVTRVDPGVGETAPTFYHLERLGSDGQFHDISGVTRFSGAGPWSYFDPLVQPGEQVTFRSRGVYITASGKEVASAWVQGTATLTDRHQWWLRDRVEPLLNRRLSVVSHEETIPKPQEVAYGAAARGATVTHQGVRASRHQVTVRCLTAQSYEDLRALIDTGRTLVLVTGFGVAAQVQVGEQISVGLIKAAPTPSESTPIRASRTVTMELIEVEQ